MNWHVFVIVLGEKLLQTNQPLCNFCLWGCKAAVSLLMWLKFSVYAEESLIMERMRMLANCVELHHCILSWHPWASKFQFFSKDRYSETLLQARTLRTLESVPLEPTSNFHITSSKNTFWEGWGHGGYCEKVSYFSHLEQWLDLTWWGKCTN